MPARGTVISEESRERYRKAARSRKSQLIRLRIVSEEEFNRATAHGLKWCGTCKTFKSPDDFFKGQTKCKPCSAQMFKGYYAKNGDELRSARRSYYYKNHKDQLRKRKNSGLKSYGATQEWYDRKLAEQGNGCAICGASKPSKGQAYFSVDHNHSCCTKQKTACNNCRRGLLCARCNTSLERLESHAGWFESAVAYLRRYGSLA